MKTLFFTYGTLKSGESRNNVLTQSDSKLVGHGFTERRDCSLRRTDEKPFGFPVFLPNAITYVGVEGYWRSRINRMPFCDTLIWQMGDKSTKTYQFRNS
jgi:gamma-glutamylcyclotransferase (GGCT)/AIG2-like uncharacterized protein YtfP